MPASVSLRMSCKRLALKTLPPCRAFSTVPKVSVDPPPSFFYDADYEDLAQTVQQARSQVTTVSSWKRLAALTNDPMIDRVSKRLETERSLPQTLTLAMKDPRPCMILSIDNQDESSVARTVINVNDAFTRLSGYPREEALNQSIETLLCGPETEREAADAMMETIEMGQERTAEGVVTHYARNGRKFHDLMRLGTIMSGDGSTRYLLCVLHEIAIVGDNSSAPRLAA